MASEKMKKEYADMIAASKKKWDGRSSEFKEVWKAGLTRKVGGFLGWWDTLKELEKKFNNLYVWKIAEEVRYQSAFAHGQRLARNYKKHGLKELYDAFLGAYVGVGDYEFLEFNDEICSLKMHVDPYLPNFTAAGRTESEIKEMAPYFWLWWPGVISGFNPQFESFVPVRLIMKGDSYTGIHVADRLPPSSKGVHRLTGQVRGPWMPYMKH